MGIVRELNHRVRSLLTRAADDREMDEELAVHIEMEAERLVSLGVAPGEALRMARAEFGPLEAHREALREGRRFGIVEDGWRDARYAMRSLRRAPGYTLTIVATLSVGIGTAVAIDHMARKLFEEPLPVPEIDRLFSASLATPRGFGRNALGADYAIWSEEVSDLATLAAHGAWTRTLTADGATTFARGYQVTGDFFNVLGTAPIVGRTLLPTDAAGSAALTVLLGERVWRGRFASDPAVVERTVAIDGRDRVVVGVMPEELQFPSGADLWVPMDPAMSGVGNEYVSVIGRMAPGTPEQSLGAAIDAIQTGLEADRPEAERTGAVLLGGVAGAWAIEATQVTTLLRISALLLLLVGIANAASLTITRGIGRAHEIGVRASLGASRGRIVRQLLTESSALALAAGLCSLVVAYLAIESFRGAPAEQFTHDNLIGWYGLGLDRSALLSAFVIAVLTGLGFGILPALHTVRFGRPATSEGGPRSIVGGRNRVARVLLACEVALALALLLPAGLLARSIWELTRMDPGYQVAGVVTARWSLPDGMDATGPGLETFRNRLEREMPLNEGSGGVHLVSNLPITSLGAGWMSEYAIEGEAPAADRLFAGWRSVSPGALDALSIRRTAGRGFAQTDDGNAPPVALVSESFVQRHWAGGADPLGQRIEVENTTWTVVGVVADVIGRDRRPETSIYVPIAQDPAASGFAVATVAGEPGAAIQAFPQAIWRIDPRIAVGPAYPLATLLAEEIANDRALTLMIAFFAGTAFLITLTTLYALVTGSVTRRRREIGVRLAIGAAPGRIVRTAMATGLRSTAIGAIVGMALALGLSRLLAGMLYGIGPSVPVVVGSVAIGFLAVAALSAYLPARRAAHIDPAIVLKEP